MTPIVPLPSRPPLTVILLWGDALDALTHLPAESVQAVVTDPPYGLVNEAGHDNDEMIKVWRLGQDYHGGRGYRGALWDNSVPGPSLWRACARCLVPAGAVLAFGGTRTFARLLIALVKGGLKEHDMINWTYPGGQPLNSMDLSARAGTRIPALRGNSPRLLPAHEPIAVFRKAREMDVSPNILSFGVGGVRVRDVSLTRRKDGIASNHWVLHEIGCTPEACVDGCTAAESELSGATPIWPSAEIPEGNLGCNKPGSRERVDVDGQRHETQKPVAVLSALVRAFSLPGHTILDPFAGSGSTIEAALLQGRNAVGVELREGECAGQIRRRIARAQAALAEEGITVVVREFRVEGPAQPRFPVAEANDAVGRWLRQTFVVDDTTSVPAQALQASYAGWAHRNAEPALTPQQLATELRTHGLERRATGRSRRIAWHGLQPRATAPGLVDIQSGAPVDELPAGG